MHTEFDFETLIDRNHTGCAKWNRRTAEEKALHVVPMSVADMELASAPCVVDALSRAAAHGMYGYTDPDEPYFEAVMHWMQTRHQFEVSREWIVAQTGVVPAMSIAVRTFTSPGDRVILQTPGYPPFRSAILENGREPSVNPLVLGGDGQYRMDLEDLRARARDPKTTLMFLCSPHNPVGRVWTAQELRAVAEICLENQVLLVCDEIHFDLSLTKKHTVLCNAAPEVLKKCLILTSPSKTFNTAGLLIANTIIPDEGLRKAFLKRLSADGFCANISYFGYHGTIAAYQEGAPWVDAMLAHVRGNFKRLDDFLRAHLPKIRLLPAEGTYLAWTDWRALGMEQRALEGFVRGEAKIVVNSGSFFGEGAEGFFRINLALPAHALSRELERLLSAMRAKGLA